MCEPRCSRNSSDTKSEDLIRRRACPPSEWRSCRIRSGRVPDPLVSDSAYLSEDSQHRRAPCRGVSRHEIAFRRSQSHQASRIKLIVRDHHRITFRSRDRAADDVCGLNTIRRQVFPNNRDRHNVYSQTSREPTRKPLPSAPVRPFISHQLCNMFFIAILRLSRLELRHSLGDLQQISPRLGSRHVRRQQDLSRKILVARDKQFAVGLDNSGKESLTRADDLSISVVQVQ